MEKGAFGRPFLSPVGLPQSAATRAVNRYLWTALAGRSLQPGVQADMAIVLVGGQGVGKTRGVEAMALLPEAAGSIDLTQRDTDTVRRLRGKQVVELAELRGIRSREKEYIKHFLTERFDEWTPKYQEMTVRAPRRCVFFGTSNEEEFLDDDTGERRWLPIRVGAVDVAGIKAAATQLWAEAAAEFTTDGIAWKEAQTLAGNEHEEYRVEDSSWEQALRVHASVSPQGVTVRSGAEFLGVELKMVTKAVEMRIAHLYRQIGLVKVRQMRLGGDRKNYWVAK